ncbi:coiled-coil domain-containing protein 81-like isoform X2 [Periplaneta americana]|uniref:coiled-coil domain-containing protein 81-like isoform X2 n=1 Tax=Periplaneta americana TaxID=6978 RepID=UPI0037E8F036
MTRKIFDEVLNNYKTLIGKRYSKAALTKVWDGVSRFIRKKLQHGKGVTIKNLGTFTFSEWKTFVGNKNIETKHPAFVISEKLVQFYNLRSRIPYTTGRTPICMLNHATIACSIGEDRQMVEACVTEVTEALARLLSQDQDVEIPFPNIGNLYVRNKQVTMNFHQDILKTTGDRFDSSNKESKFAREINFEKPRHTSSPLPEENITTNNQVETQACEQNES